MSRKPSDYTTQETDARIFKNPVLNFLGKTHISIPLIIFFGAGVALSSYAFLVYHLSLISIISYFICGLLFFTLIEYLMHRFLYHLPSVYEEGRIAYALHGLHHKYPKDKKLLVMPPVMSVLLASLVLGINYLIFGENGLAFTGGFLFGYAAYLSVHFIVHAFKPPKNLFKELWVNHSIHHYQDDEKAFGVSSPLWDYVFGTMPNKKQLRK
ncbi:MAG: fatty acid hydroxylase [Flavobacteriales bacterium]|nr:fatty acid hydroxylase [Flavobacteriales bacterium]